jgi:hypothetical protein
MDENYPQRVVMVSITAGTNRKQILSTNSHGFLRIGNNAKRSMVSITGPSHTPMNLVQAERSGVHTDKAGTGKPRGSSAARMQAIRNNLSSQTDRTSKSRDKVSTVLTFMASITFGTKETNSSCTPIELVQAKATNRLNFQKPSISLVPGEKI